MKKIIISLSGGIDSAVAGALLKKKKFEVFGVFMRLWNFPPEREKRAKKIAEILKIPFFVFDFEKEFKIQIVDNYFLKELKKGLTPNPCVICNKKIKFGLLLEKIKKELKIEKLATGHYARISKTKKGIFKIFRAKDEKKDQSYFLWMLNQNQIKKIVFPLGNFLKEEVKNLAKKFKLDFLLKVPQSSNLCFVKNNFYDFLKSSLSQKEGFILDEYFKILGKHKGLAFYTIGQREKIGISGGPFYVLKKDLKNNFLIVTKDEKKLYKKEVIFEKPNWICRKEPNFPLKVKAKIRYQQKLSTAKIVKIKKNLYKAIFKEPQRAVTPGQSIVFYKQKELLGGAKIKS